jgi:chromosome segregation ATPase
MRSHADENSTPGQKKAAVVGFIANLVTVEDDLYCRILAWHLGANMKCLVVRDNEAAAIYSKDFKVLSLASAKYSDKKWPCSEDKLAATHGGKYLLNRAVFKKELNHEANVAMNATVGDVIVFPTVKNALDYRTALRAKKRGCGVLYTEDGKKIAGSGITGGRDKSNQLPFMKELPVTFAKENKLEQIVKLVLVELDVLSRLLQTMGDYERAKSVTAERFTSSKVSLQKDLNKLEQDKKELKEKRNKLGGSRKHARGDDPQPPTGRRVKGRTAGAAAVPRAGASASAARVASEASNMGWSAPKRSRKE